jgi:maleate isomerase
VKRTYRIGQIVPSSNTTMETEIPHLLRARQQHFDEEFTFHSSRMRMQKVTKEQLSAMDGESLRCAAELADARVDVMGYACLVAIMAMGPGYHRTSERRLSQTAKDTGGAAPIVTSAGALIEGILALNAKKVAIITPYMKPLTKLVVDYIENEGIEVVDAVSLEIEDNLAVGRRDADLLLNDISGLSYSSADAVVLSACVQMPSLAAIEKAEVVADRPVLSSAIATSWRMLRALDLEAEAPGGGSLLSMK